MGLRRSAVLLLIFVALLSGSQVQDIRPVTGSEGGTGGGRILVERCRSAVSGRDYAVYFDPDSGTKWIEDSNGGRYPSFAAVWDSELRSVGEPWCRLAAPLRARILADEGTDDPILVTLHLRERPLGIVAAELREAAYRDITELMAPAREIAARVREKMSDAKETAGRTAEEIREQEESHLTDGERAFLRQLAGEARTRLREFRAAAIEKAIVLCDRSQKPVLARLSEYRVVGRSALLNAITVEMPASRLPDLLVACPEIWTVNPVLKGSASLDKSIGAIGAGSWHTGGYDGSSLRVGMIDSGIDDQHPALKTYIAAQSRFHTAAVQQSDYGELSSSKSDKHGHGNHLAGIVASRGYSGTIGGVTYSDGSYKGVAKGATLVNAKALYLNKSGGLSFMDSDVLEATQWALSTAGSADVLCIAFGATGGSGTSNLAKLYDAVVGDLGVPVAVAAGNNGTSTGAIDTPGDAYNVITVGNLDDNNTTSVSDDGLFSTSSQGPTSDGRRKPELVAPGTKIRSTIIAWAAPSGSSTWTGFGDMTGSSQATAHLAGALTLLVDYQSTWRPNSLKAVLLNTTQNSSPFNSTPDQKMGWGGLDLAAAYTARANCIEGSNVSTGDADHYYRRSTSLASGDRATLVWDRRAIYSSTTWPGTPPSLLDLDLYLYDGGTGTEATKSISTVDPVEQVKAPGTVATPVLRIHRAGSYPSAFSTQNWSLATPGTFTEVDPPDLSAAFGSLGTQASGASFQLKVTVTNGGDLTAISPKVTLTLPTGFTLDSGTNPVTLSSIAGGGSAVATFSLSAPSSSTSSSVTAAVASTGYGKTWSAPVASTTVVVDATPPVATVAIKGGDDYTNGSSVTLTLSATDAASGVSSMAFSHDGSTWTNWETYATSKSWTLTAGEGTKTVYARFKDGLGNVATVSDTILLDTVAPVVTVLVNGGDTYTKSSTVTAAFTVTEAGSGMDKMRFQVDSTNSSSWSTYETYAATKTLTMSAGEGKRYVYANFVDKAGNPSANYVDAIYLDTVAPSGTVSINNGAGSTNATSATLTLSASDSTSGVHEMRFSNDGTTWSSWEEYAASRSWTLAAGEGTKTVRAEIRDEAGNVLSLTDTILMDTTAPTASVAIDAGDDFAKSASTTLSLTATDGASGVYQMAFSHDGSTWTSFESFNATRAWALASGDGTKKVWVRIRDYAGNVAEVTDSIVLDTVAPVVTVLVNGGDPYTNSSTVTATFSVTEAGSGMDRMRFQVDSTNSYSWSTYETYAATKTLTMSAGDGKRYVYAQFVDKAGNASAAYVDAINLETVAPTGTVTIDSGAAYTNSTAVKLGLTSSDNQSGVSDMRFSNDGSTWSDWQDIAATADWTIATGDGTKTVRAEIRDSAGNVTQLTDGIVVDTGKPSGTITVNSGDAWTQSGSVTVALTASDGDSGVSQMRLSNDGSSWSAWESFTASLTWTLSPGNGAKTVHAEISDRAGNVVQVTDGITVDTTSPTASLSINGGAQFTTSPTVLLAVGGDDGTEGTGVTKMRFSTDGTNWSAWTPYAATTSYTLGTADGTQTAFAQVMDGAGNTSTTVSDSILLDGTAPTGSVSIEGGDPYTDSATVALTLASQDTGSGVSEMRFSFDGSNWAAWETAVGTKSLTLPGGDGPKTVYVEFRDGAGNIVQASDQIFVDSGVPTGTVEVGNGGGWTTSTDAALTLTGTDNFGGSGVADMRFSNDGTAWSAWETFATSRTWTLPSGGGSKSIYFQVRDAAGNVSTADQTTVMVDTNAPSLSIGVGGGATWATVRDVKLTSSASDDLSGVGDFRWRYAGDAWSAWKAYDSDPLDITLPDEDGEVTVEAQVRDKAGNVSDSATAAITLDRVAPLGSVSIDDGDENAGSTAVSLTLAASDGVSGVADMRLSANGTEWTAWEAHSATKSWTLSGGDGTHRVYAQYRDRAGNVSAVLSDEIFLDTRSPTVLITIDGGAEYAQSRSVELSFAADDGAGSGIASVRMSNDGADWGTWKAWSAARFWTLDEGDGSKTVYAQVRDAAGHESAVATATIALDASAPFGSVLIDDDAAATNTSIVELAFTAADATSGVEAVRYRIGALAWGDWDTSFAGGAGGRLTVDLGPGEGLRSASVQIRDRAGNVSDVNSDDIRVDQTKPTGTFAINDGKPYIGPTEDMRFDVDARDEPGGSGVSDCRVSYDEGANWSKWHALTGKTVLVARPSSDGPGTATLVIRDLAGNESDAVQQAFHLLGDNPGALPSGASATGTIQDGSTVNAYVVEMVKGDALSVKAKGKAAGGGKVLLDLALDVVMPSGNTLSTGRYPAGSKKPGIKKLIATETGTHLLIVRLGSAGGAQQGTFQLKVKIKQGKAGKAPKGTASDGIVRFDALNGATLKGSLTAAGLTPDRVKLFGPDGREIPLGAKESKKGPKLSTTVLTGGTGTYEIRCEGATSVGYKLRVKPSKGVGG